MDERPIQDALDFDIAQQAPAKAPRTQKNKNDIAWEQIFADFDILKKIATQGHYIISATTIRTYREPRLMAKYDSSDNLPEIFKKHRLGILPLSRGTYVISHYNVYQECAPSTGHIQCMTVPVHLCSISADQITSEAAAINAAYVSGILEDFLEEAVVPTVSGRMSSGQFDFDIYNTSTKRMDTHHVDNAQIEVDGGYESANSLALIEAKLHVEADFITRQLYYPTRLFHSRMGSKRVRPIFLVYTNGIFDITEYDFDDIRSYNSVAIRRHQRYSLEPTQITFEAIMDVFRDTTPVEEPAIPFPQADSFERVINFCELLMLRPFTREEMTIEFGFTDRQMGYYANAARYLGLLERYDANEGFILSEQGRSIMGQNYVSRQLSLVRCMFRHEPFRKIFEIYMQMISPPTARHGAQILSGVGIYNVQSEATLERRARTVISWLRWVMGLCESATLF
ncbi:MAG: hypothetical protein Q3972_00565 [Corynebacterium sp.]|nr:hypothetical protein [Corynebacterium sp.]